jgi:hypothetical protein
MDLENLVLVTQRNKPFPFKLVQVPGPPRPLANFTRWQSEVMDYCLPGAVMGVVGLASATQLLEVPLFKSEVVPGLWPVQHSNIWQLFEVTGGYLHGVLVVLVGLEMAQLLIEVLLFKLEVLRGLWSMLLVCTTWLFEMIIYYLRGVRTLTDAWVQETQAWLPPRYKLVVAHGLWCLPKQTLPQQFGVMGYCLYGDSIVLAKLGTEQLPTEVLQRKLAVVSGQPLMRVAPTQWHYCQNIALDGVGVV